VAIDELTYPAPRERTGSVPTAPLPPVGSGQPTTRVWAFRIRQGTPNVRTILGGPVMHGPSIIKSLTFRHTQGVVAPVISAWQIGYSTTPVVNQINGSQLTPLPGPSILDVTRTDDTPAAPARPATFEGMGVLLNNPTTPILFDFPVYAAEWYPWVVFDNPQAANTEIQGILSVICGVSQAALANFL